MKSWKRLGGVLVVSLAAGCASTQSSQYYTLSPVSLQGDVSSRGNANNASALADDPASPQEKIKRGAPFAISVQPVILPDQVNRPQIVVSTPGSTQVVPLNGSLWASPLADEIRNALANELSRALGALDVSSNSVPQSLAVWRVDLSVQRFESVYDQSALLDATWRLTPVNQRGKVRICAAEAQVPVDAGMAALVRGHQMALHEIAAVIISELQGRSSPPASSMLRFKGCVS
jgi:uncharacterized lipoprotein YmbA